MSTLLNGAQHFWKSSTPVHWGGWQLEVSELSLANCVEWNYSNVSHVYQISICTAVEQANIKAQSAVTAGFLNVMGAIECTPMAIKAHHKMSLFM